MDQYLETDGSGKFNRLTISSYQASHRHDYGITCRRTSTVRYLSSSLNCCGRSNAGQLSINDHYRMIHEVGLVHESQDDIDIEVNIYPLLLELVPNLQCVYAILRKVRTSYFQTQMDVRVMSCQVIN